MVKNKKILILGFAVIFVTFSIMLLDAISFGDITNLISPVKDRGEISITQEQHQDTTAPVIAVTIYGNNIAFIKRQGSFDSDEGKIIELTISNFTQPIKDSLFIYDNKARIKEWYFKDSKRVEEVKEDITPNFEEILNESLGKEIKVRLFSNDSFSGKLSWLEDSRIGIEFSNGVLFLNLNDIKEFLIFEANVSKRVKTENKSMIIPELIIKEVPTEKGTHDLILSYLRSGADWEANYRFYTNSENEEDFGTLQSWAFVTNNADENWNNVLLKLVVGYPNIIYYQPVFQDYYMEKTKAEAMMAPIVEEKLIPESVGEYCVYTLDEKVTINRTETKNLPIFSKEIKFKRKYLWNANLGNDVYKIYEINNTLDVPFAEGIFSVYLKGEFEGQDKIEYTAKESVAEVKVAKSPDVVVKKEILEKNEEKTAEDWPKRYSTRTYYKVKLSIENHKDSDASLIIKDEMQQGDEVNLISSTIQPGKKLYSLKWEIKLKGSEKKNIEYEYEVKNFYV